MAFDNFKECTPDLPDTAPTEENVETTHEEPYWGKLIQITDQGQSMRVLTAKCYRIGRAPTCELPVTEHDVGTELCTKISKIHCRLYRDTFDDQHLVFLEDLSLNGTYVNNKKVGKNERILLHHTAEISLAAPSFKMYLYIDNNNNNQNDWLHESIVSKFCILKHLGSGAFGDVRLVLDQQTYRRYAMKKISKHDVPECKIYNEVYILKRLNHPFIVNVENVFDTPEAVFITLEYMPGGNLLSRIKELRKIPEPECKLIFYQLLLGIQYLHEEGITHRDLKPENVLVNTQGSCDYIIVKITDFGLSKVIDSKTELKSICGTMKYMAPEILARYAPTYTNKVDIWSLGVMLFYCLSGEHPFFGDKNALAAKIVIGKYEMTRSGWHLISKHAKQLVQKILVIDPLKRISISSILHHPWFKDERIIQRIDEIIRIINNANREII